MTDVGVAEQVERAFAYRGHVTVSRRDGTSLVGFLYDRGATHVELFDEHASRRIRLAIDEIAAIALTGEDSAAAAQRRWERRRGALEPRDTPAWGDWDDRPVLILVALPVELRAVAPVLGARPRGAIARGRLGDARAAVRAIGIGGGAAHVVAAERPGLVVNVGLSGALEPSLTTGDLVLASAVRDDTGDVVVAPEIVRRTARRALDGVARVAEGELLCATEVAATRDDKRAAARPGLLAVDLESWAVARAAERAGLPWLALRVVLDPLDLDLPAWTRRAGAGHVQAALRHGLRGPRAAVELARLGRRAVVATRALRRALQRLAPALGRLGAAQGRA